jgi:hypothetical protein
MAGITGRITLYKLSTFRIQIAFFDDRAVEIASNSLPYVPYNRSIFVHILYLTTPRYFRGSSVRIPNIQEVTHRHNHPRAEEVRAVVPQVNRTSKGQTGHNEKNNVVFCAEIVSYFYFNWCFRSCHRGCATLTHSATSAVSPFASTIDFAPASQTLTSVTIH